MHAMWNGYFLYTFIAEYGDHWHWNLPILWETDELSNEYELSSSHDHTTQPLLQLTCCHIYKIFSVAIVQGTFQTLKLSFQTNLLEDILFKLHLGS